MAIVLMSVIRQATFFSTRGAEHFISPVITRSTRFGFASMRARIVRASVVAGVSFMVAMAVGIIIAPSGECLSDNMVRLIIDCAN